jgi:multidrug efflux pump subunit AcrA (membrane-fusion protein)
MRALALLALISAAGPALAGSLTLGPTPVTEWKAVYGRVEARDTVPARARIGGIVVELEVSEGDLVEAGEQIATVRDDKLAFQVAALDAQIRALEAQLATAEIELGRGEALVERGVATAQRLDQLRTSVDVTRNQLAAAEAQRSVVVQQEAEGGVVSPAAGRVLTVPVTRGAVVLAGERWPPSAAAASSCAWRSRSAMPTASSWARRSASPPTAPSPKGGWPASTRRSRTAG